MFDVVPIETPSLGDRSYVVVAGDVAVVIDPQRDIDRVLAVTEPRDLRISAVLETHLHNDYVTGGLSLARRCGADYVVSADDEVAFDRRAVRDGDELRVGDLLLRAMSTPGHTEHHLSWIVELDGQVRGVFTGGSMLYGATGRTDLVRPDRTEALTRRQHSSVRGLAAALPETTPVFPTHGFGSFCAAGESADRKQSTLALERTDNPALRLDEDAFVAETIAGLDTYPAYYDHMGPLNASGPTPADLSRAPSVGAAEIGRRIGAGQWVVDLRSPEDFAARHVAGSLFFGLDGSMPVYLGWLLPWGDPLTLLGADEAQVAEAQRELVRIGIDRPAGAAVGGPDDWAGDRPLASFATARFADLVDAVGRADTVVLDVRAASEWRDGHVRGAVHVPLDELPSRLADVPAGTLWVHCGSGYRATIAASLLAREGRAVVTVLDEFDNAASAGVPLEPAA